METESAKQFECKIPTFYLTVDDPSVQIDKMWITE